MGSEMCIRDRDTDTSGHPWACRPAQTSGADTPMLSSKVCHSPRRSWMDDILVWATDLTTMAKRLQIILDRCRKKNITISDTKFEIATTLKFAGFIISEDDISPDPIRTKAIRAFPRPANIHDVRLFLGLANTLTNFVPDLIQATEEMR